MKDITYTNMVSSIKKLEIYQEMPLRELNSLLISTENDVSCYYIPFDYINTNAKVVLVGITPGKTQLINALTSVQDSLSNNFDSNKILRIAKEEGAFSGTLRDNLVQLLDFIGLNTKLGIHSTQSLFDIHSNLVHTTSLLRHPVFIKNNNYSGTTPNILNNRLLFDLMNSYFIKEIKLLQNAIYIPLGSSVEMIFKNYIIKNNLLPEKQVLFGIPHPSGANNERIAYFLNKKNKSELSKKTNADKIDIAKTEILNKLHHFKFD